MTKFWKENWVEIITVIAILLGILAVSRRAAIRNFIDHQLPTLQTDLVNLFIRVLDKVSGYISQLSLVEMAGFAIVLLCILFILFRIRYRFFRSQRWRSSGCPRCGGELYRVHRSTFDRMLSSTLLPHARRYLCQNPDCEWTGLKNIERAGRRRRSGADSFSFDSQK
jgi:hypothetical protein